MENRNWSQRWEDNYPSILSALWNGGVVLFLYLHKDWIGPTREGVIKLAPSVLNVSAMAVGFLATAETLLLTLSDSSVMKDIRDNGHSSRLFSFFGRAIATSFVTAVFAAFIAAMHLEHGGALRYLIVVVWSYFGIAALFCYFRSSQMLSYILDAYASRPKKSAQEPSLKGEQNKTDDYAANDIEILEG